MVLQINSAVVPSMAGEPVGVDESCKQQAASVSLPGRISPQCSEERSAQKIIGSKDADTSAVGGPMNNLCDGPMSHEMSPVVGASGSASTSCEAVSVLEMREELAEVTVDDKLPMWAHAPFAVQHQLLSHGNLMRTLDALGTNLEKVMPVRKAREAPCAVQPAVAVSPLSVPDSTSCVTDVERSRQVAKDTGVTPLNLASVPHRVDRSEALATHSTIVEERKGPVERPPGLARMLNRENWLRSALHDPLAIIPLPEGEILGSQRQGGQRMSSGAADCGDRGNTPGVEGRQEEGMPPPGAAPVVIAFRRGSRNAHNKPDAEPIKLRQTPGSKGPAEVPFGSIGACRVSCVGALLASRSPTQPQKRHRRPGELRGVATRGPPLAPVSSVQVEITSRFDSEQGFVDGLYDAEQNVLYVR
jgi:hypothetical protein